MQFYRFFLPLSFLAIAPVPGLASAQDFYVEGAVGAGTFETENVLSDISDDDFNLVGARAGWEVNEYFAVEGEYFFGLNDHQQSYPNGFEPFIGLATKASIDSAYGIFAKTNAPIGDALNLFARVGYAGVETDYDGRYEAGEREDFSYSDTDYDIAFGVGASYDFTDRFYARVDATTYSIEWLDKQSITVGAGVRF